MRLPLRLAALTLSTACASCAPRTAVIATSATPGDVRTGLEVALSDSLAVLQGKRLGLITNRSLWRSFPVVDIVRWFGFDLFCAWLDVFLMSFFFLLSGLFVWPSLERKGARTFLADRLLRIGLPFTVIVGWSTATSSSPGAGDVTTSARSPGCGRTMLPKVFTAPVTDARIVGGRSANIDANPFQPTCT